MSLQNMQNLNEARCKLFNPSRCSCEECDSVDCFKKRRTGRCLCEKCGGSETCLFYANKMAGVEESKSEIINGACITKKMQLGGGESTSNVNKQETFREEIILDNKTNVTSTKQTHSKISYKPSSYEENKDDYFEDNEFDFIHGITEGHSFTKILPSTVKLSAQVMNLPYDDFKHSISFCNNDESRKSTLTKFDILDRIKEAYKACSCKVCECITSLPILTRNGVCQCKPCECEDCRRLMNQLKGVEQKHISKKNCQWLMCTKKKCDEFMKTDNLLTKCNCKPCNCDECVKFKYVPKPCDCAPCDCIQCRIKTPKTRTFIVAPMEEYNRQPVCSCSPCGCIECERGFGTIARSLTHEMATGITRPRNCRCEACLNESCDEEGIENCRCEGHDGVMRKPVQRDTNDYDIRSALIPKINHARDKNKFNKHDTVAMFATVTNAYPTSAIRGTVNLKNVNDSEKCNCDECECVLCKQKKNVQTNVKESEDLLKSVSKICGCSQCDCKACSAYRNNGACFVKSNDGRYNYQCFDCIGCVNLQRPSCSNRRLISKNPLEETHPEGKCNCKPCECLDCQKLKIQYAGEVSDECEDKICNEMVYPIKKGELLKLSVPNTLQPKYYVDKVQCYHEGPKTHTPVKSKNSGQDILIYASYPFNNYMNKAVKKASITHLNSGNLANMQNFSEYNNTLSDKPGMIYHSNETRISENNNEMQCQLSNSYLSARSSIATSKLSYYLNVSDTSTPVPSKKRATISSWQSSSNSSGHDYPDYLIRFPRTAAETCINEVMKLNLDKKVVFNRLNVSSKTNLRNHCVRSLSFNNKSKQTREQKYICQDGKQYIGPVKKNEACDCNPCDCDQCTLSTSKLKRCACKCLACNCYGGCMSEDQSIFIRKNEETQTSAKFLQELGQSFDAQNNSNLNKFETEFIKLNTQLYPLFPNKEFGISKEGSNLTHPSYLYFNKYVNEGKKFTTWNYIDRSLESYKSALDNHSIISSIPIQINYDSVHNTLREARAFSLELMKILEKYEKANREFESVSQKLKYSHESLLGSYVSSKRTSQALHEPQQVEQENDFWEENPPREVNNTENKSSTKNISQPIYQEETCEVHMSETDEDINGMKNNIDKDALTFVNCENNIEKSIAQSLSSYIFDEVCKKIFIGPQETQFKSRYKKYRKLIKRAVILSRRFNLKHSSTANESVTGTDTDPVTQIEDKKIVTGIYKNIEHLNESMAVKAKCNERSLSEGKQFDKKKSEDNFISESIPTIEEDKSNPISEKLQEEKYVNDCRNWAVLKKNLFIDTPSRLTSLNVTTGLEPKEVEEDGTIDDNKNWIAMNQNLLTDIPTDLRNVGVVTLEQDVKEAVNMVSLQTCDGDNKGFPIPPYGNVALANLQVEVNRLLNMPQLKTQNELTNNINYTSDGTSQRKLQNDLGENTKILLDLTPAKTTRSKFNDDKEIKTCIPAGKSSLDQLKISFYSVRRVSDHTILVKWNLPQDTTDVQGYELLVDGRAVQKILSPTRSMAVVTCLPHNDKVLLTIRTITSVSHSGRYPSTTIVYRPRAK